MIRAIKFQKNIILASLLVSAFLLSVLAVYRYLPVDIEWSEGNHSVLGVDWKGAFQPAARALLAGENPYSHPAYNPPWVFLPLLPVALLPPALGAAVMFVLGIVMFGLAASRFGAPPWLIALFLTTPFVILNSKTGNIDWMIAFGATLPPQIGLFLVMSKPQLGVGIAIFWLVQAWRAGGWQEILRVFSPVSIGFLLSFALYGFWPLKTLSLSAVWWNASLFPYGAVVGLVLLYVALRARLTGLAVSASPFFAPYISYHGWSMAVFGLLRHPVACAVVIALLWALQLWLGWL